MIVHSFRLRKFSPSRPPFTAWVECIVPDGLGHWTATTTVQGYAEAPLRVIDKLATRCRTFFATTCLNRYSIKFLISICVNMTLLGCTLGGNFEAATNNDSDFGLRDSLRYQASNSWELTVRPIHPVCIHTSKHPGPNSGTSLAPGESSPSERGSISGRAPGVSWLLLRELGHAALSPRDVCS